MRARAGSDADRATLRAAQRTAMTLVAEWQELRRQIRQIEEAEHPPIVDNLGRAWTWINKSLYGHDGMAWDRDVIEQAEFSLPLERILTNPNYRWCDICRGPAARLDGRRVPVVTVVAAEGRP